MEIEWEMPKQHADEEKWNAVKESRKFGAGWSWRNTTYLIYLITLLKADAVVFQSMYWCKVRISVDRSNLKRSVLVLLAFLPAGMWGRGKSWCKVVWVLSSFWIFVSVCTNILPGTPCPCLNAGYVLQVYFQNISFISKHLLHAWLHLTLHVSCLILLLPSFRSQQNLNVWLSAIFYQDKLKFLRFGVFFHP